jgi:hypothetical protein
MEKSMVLELQCLLALGLRPFRVERKKSMSMPQHCVSKFRSQHSTLQGPLRSGNR